jgi:hypothetical protein
MSTCRGMMGRMGMPTLILCGISTALIGCYSGGQVSPDINASWRQHKASEIRSDWGAPKTVQPAEDGSVHVWTIEHRHFTLPTLRAKLDVGPGGLDAYGEARAGEKWTTTTDVAVHVDLSGLITRIEGPSLRWGPPDDANLRWGLLMGMHAGMGRLDDTATPLPSGGLYIGGMLGPTLGLVGSYSFTSGSDDAGGAIGMAWAVGPQWWPATRLSLRAGPAMILAFNPGFEDAGLEAGVNGSASYALIRSGTFTLDVRMDLTAGSSTRFGNVGVGVNLN